MRMSRRAGLYGASPNGFTVTLKKHSDGYTVFNENWVAYYKNDDEYVKITSLDQDIVLEGVVKIKFYGQSINGRTLKVGSTSAGSDILLVTYSGQYSSEITLTSDKTYYCGCRVS